MGVGGAHGVQLRRPPQSPFQLRYPFQRLNHNIKLRNCLRSSKGGTVPSPSEDPVVPVVGIDLGTTNSAIAWMEGGKPRCIPGPDGSRIVPSVVHFAADGSVVVGKDARRLLAANPRTTFYSVKRVIGRSWDDPVVQEEAKRVSYEVRRRGEHWRVADVQALSCVPPPPPPRAAGRSGCSLSSTSRGAWTRGTTTLANARLSNHRF